MSFRVGEDAFHVSKGKRCVVVLYDNGLYVVKHSGFLWSVPETALRPVAKRAAA